MADIPERVSPERVGLDPRALRRLTAAMAADVEHRRIAGAVGMIVRDGKTAYLEAVGCADRERGHAAASDTIFRIYSMTKPLTSAALLLLEDEGRVRLEDPVTRHLPEFADAEVVVEDLAPGEFGADGLVALLDGRTPPPAAAELVDTLPRQPVERPMTVRDLLQHTSGLTYGFFPRPLVDRLYWRAKLLHPANTLASMVAKLAALPLKHQPGTCFEYSLSTDVASRIVEVVSGQSFERFLAERLTGPLGMADTTFRVPPEKLARFAQLYTRNEDFELDVHPPNESVRFAPGAALASGGSGLVSTVHDYERFCRMVLDGGVLEGERVLSERTVLLLTTDSVPADVRGRGSFGYGFGMGFGVCTDPDRAEVRTSVGELNWGGIAGTKFWIDPAERMIGLYMVQVLPHIGMRFGLDFKQGAYDALQR